MCAARFPVDLMAYEQRIRSGSISFMSPDYQGHVSSRVAKNSSARPDSQEGHTTTQQPRGRSIRRVTERVCHVQVSRCTGEDAHSCRAKGQEKLDECV